MQFSHNFQKTKWLFGASCAPHALDVANTDSVSYLSMYLLARKNTRATHAKVEFVRKKVLISILLTLVMALFLVVLVACGENAKEAAQVKVVYELEGGVYQNTSLPVVLYFPYAEGESGTIVDPMTLTGKEFEKSGYVLDGWYRTKNGTDDAPTYDNRWDFATDRVTNDGTTLTLFAKWKPAVEYTYNVVYVDEASGEKVTLGTYPVADGERFEDYLGYASRRTGYTMLGYRDADGNPWDMQSGHPGGDASLAVDVYVDYIPGNYTLVSTPAEFSSALSRGRNIYLTADIDFAGAKLNAVSRYAGTLQGNGHTIRGFVLGYDASAVIPDYEDDSASSLYISLLGDTKGAEVHAVTIEGSLNITSTYSRMSGTIYCLPLATVAEGSTFADVAVRMTYTVGALRAGLGEEDLVIVTDRLCYTMDGASTADACSVNITKQGE